MQRKEELARAEIYRGRQHKLVFLALEKNALMVSEITRKINKLIRIDEGKTLTLREVSRALKWLAQRGYAECLNPSSKHGVKGIVYRASHLGDKLSKLLNKSSLEKDL